MSTWWPTASLDALQQRAAILAKLRGFFADREILEVQTPLLGRATVTDPDVDGVEVPGYGFLQSSPEYFMKRLLVAGVPSCYQMSSAFRADERGRIHNPEFCMLEWYRLGFDGQALRNEVAALCDAVLGSAPYTEISYADLVSNVKAPREVLDLEFAQACAALNPGRFFIIDYPADQAALARLKVDDAGIAERFELVIDGIEIANGYWELTDEQEHRYRFAQDLATRETRNLPQRSVDENFLEALGQGLPDCAGVALGVDRLVMLALGESSLDGVLAFRD